MRVKVDPETFHRNLERALGTEISKTDAYFAWLDYGVRREGGPEPGVPTSAIARAVEQVIAEEGGFSAARVAERLRGWGYEYDRRNVLDRVRTDCSGFSIEVVEYWMDREPAGAGTVEATTDPDPSR